MMDNELIQGWEKGDDERPSYMIMLSRGDDWSNHMYSGSIWYVKNPKKGRIIQLPGGLRVKVVDIGSDYSRGKQQPTIYVKEYK